MWEVEWFKIQKKVLFKKMKFQNFEFEVRYIQKFSELTELFG